MIGHNIIIVSHCSCSSCKGANRHVVCQSSCRGVIQHVVGRSSYSLCEGVIGHVLTEFVGRGIVDRVRVLEGVIRYVV